jgi:localization factor PodJL
VSPQRSKEGVRQKRRSYREPDDDEDVGEDLAAVNERLDALTRQLERMANANAEPRAVAPPPAPPAPTYAPAHAPAAPPAPAPGPDRVAEALARLDRRLDQVIHESRTAASEVRQRPRYAPPPAPPAFATAPPQHVYAPAPPAYTPAPPPQAAPNRGPANWAAQISARQHALDGGPAVAAARPAPPPPAVAPLAMAPPAMAPAHWGGGADLTGLEQQLHHINTQISSLHQPYEDALGALRSDLADIARTLTDAMPRRAIEALETEVRALAERVDRTRQAGADGAALGSLERELAEVRNALRNLTPAESLGGFEDAVRALSHKIDQIAASGQAPQGDPMAFKQLEQAVVSLRGVVSNVASDGALSQLAAEVRGLGAQFERATAESSTEALAKLEARIAALMESGRGVPPELEGSVRALSERLDRMQLSQGDQLALGALEDRIAKLSEKLDASDSRLGHLEAIERGLADLLVYLEEMRSNNARALRAPPHEPAPAPAAPQRPAPEAPAAAPMAAPTPAPAPAFAQSPLDLIPEPQQPAPAMYAPQEAAPAPQQLQPLAPRAAPIEVQPMPPPESARQMAPRQMPRGPQRQPIDPNLPPDTPLEPGSGVPRHKPGSAAARIAASEAALGHSRLMSPETGNKSAAIAAARNAAKAAYLDTPVKVPKSLDRKSRGWFKWPFKKAAKNAAAEPQFHAPAPTLPPAPVLPPLPSARPAPAPSTMPPPLEFDDRAYAPVSRRGKILKVLKTLLIAASVAIIVVGMAQTAMEFLFPETPATGEMPPKDQSQSPALSEPKTRAPSTTPSRPMPAPEGTLPPASDPEQTNSIGGKSLFDPSTIIKMPDVTGSIPRKPAPPKTPAAPAGQSNNDALPASVSPILRTAALANDPAAAYELGTRYAEGRGIPQSMPDAIRWLEKAADAGFAPAQFRLASLNEKGDGLKKDLQAARRLYLTAAGKGHAKAMHNLAVLYAEGIDGKPDYKAASEWFRKAASYGVTDSQYNLAILFARGIGVQANLAESYRWFALAAANGDSDAAKKRDEVAARLDPKTLQAAQLAAQTFAPEHEPEEAINLKAPPGGWDHAPAAPAKPRR